MASSDEIPYRSFQALAWERPLIGLAQGFALWALHHAWKTHGWPAADQHIFAPALFIALFVPIAAVAALGTLRLRTLAGWLVLATLFLAAVGLHEVARGTIGMPRAANTVAAPPTFDARPEVIAAVALALFIAQALVTAGDLDRRPVAAYPTYFDVAWKQEVQLLLSLLFLGLSWGVLWLGATLFWLIGINFLKDLIGREIFALPASGLAFAVALHLTDIRVGLVQGMRNLLHMLLSWLLPLAVVLIAAFIASLPFTGLAPLWRTSHGSQIVLTAAAVLVILVNTAYRDGEAGAPVVLRWAGRAASLCLPVLVAISAYGLALRVGQRGWTETRILGLVCVIVGGCYALGYAWAAVASRPWLNALKPTNIVAAGVIIVAIAVLTTVADPARLAVNDQIARLEAGRIDPKEFDFKYLRFDAARYGRDALDRLKNATGPNAEQIKQQAERALALTSPYASLPPTKVQLTAMPVFPAGQTLPESFARQDWSKYPQRDWLPACLADATNPCEAFITATDGRQIIIIASLKWRHDAAAFELSADGTWQSLGKLSGAITCESVRQALRKGEFRWVAPKQMDLEVTNLRLTVNPQVWTDPDCH